MVKNLLKETSEVLALYGKKLNDVSWIGSEDIEIPIDKFLELADVSYDCSSGNQIVAKDLFIVGSDWWLERKFDYGAEWWIYKELPKRPQGLAVELGAVTLGQARASGVVVWGCPSLKELNER